MPGKSEIADRIAARGWSRAASSSAVEAVLDEITTALAAGERVTLTGFGTFEAATRAARTARNPRTGVSIDVPAITVARFHPGTALRSRVAAGVAVPPSALGAEPAGALAPVKVAPPTAKAPEKSSAPVKAPAPEKSAPSKAASKSAKAKPTKAEPTKAELKAAAKKAEKLAMVEAAAKKAGKSAKAKTVTKKKSDSKASSKHTKKKKK